MFNKLVSNINYNPSLINQLGFYANRLKQEALLRRLSFLFIALAMITQTFAVVSPPQKSLAASSNHIFDGLRSGNSVQTNVNLIVGAWDNTDIKDIYGYFGVTKQDIANIKTTQTQHVRIKSCDGQDWWTTGRNSLSGYSKVSDRYKNTQVSIEYQPGRYIYQRQLKAWDIVNSCNYYYALQGTIAKTGKTFYILLDCGNFTTVGRYVPPPPPEPEPVIGAVCKIAGPITIKQDATEATIPVTVTLAKNYTVPAGNQEKGLHFGVTHVGANKNWNVNDPALISAEPLVPPDLQTKYTPKSSGNSGVTYYQFKWGYDGNTYRRYYVPTQKSGSFTVRLNVAVNSIDKRVVVRLLDRGRGQWLKHNSGCEAVIQREAPPEKCPYNPNLNKNDARCKPCPVNGKEQLWAEDPNCKEPVPDPSLEIRKSILTKKTTYLPGDQLTYTIEYRNTVNGSAANDVVVSDQLDLSKVEIVDVTPAIADKGLGKIELRIASLGYKNEYSIIKVRAKIKDSVSSGDKFCNVSSIIASNSPKQTSRECANVLIPCQYDPTIPDENDKNCVEPVIACDITEAVFDSSTRKASFTTTVVSSNKDNTQIKGYYYDFGDGEEGNYTTDAYEHKVDHTYPFGRYILKTTVSYRITGQEEAEDRSVNCEEEVLFDTPLSKEKTVVNVTQNLDEEQTTREGQKVTSGDVLVYTLTTTNSVNYDKKDITIRDYVGDILEYADLDLEYLKEQGGSYDDEHKEVVWSNITIPANTSVNHTFKVKMKDAIPATNSPSTLGTAYDCEISNDYGNEVSLEVACPAVKGIETLPNTGPGASMIGGMSITMVVGYFYARTRLLKKELALVKEDVMMSGGV